MVLTCWSTDGMKDSNPLRTLQGIEKKENGEWVFLILAFLRDSENKMAGAIAFYGPRNHITVLIW